MKPKRYPIFILILSALSVLWGCNGNNIMKIYEGKVYPWKIEYINENNFPAGERHYYKVYFDGKPLTIPKEILGSTKNVDEFVAAAGFSAGDMDYASVLITLKYNFKKDDGFNDSRYVSLFIRKINGKEQTLDVETLGYEKLGEISLK